MISLHSIAENLFNKRKEEDLYNELFSIGRKVSLQEYDKIKRFMNQNKLTPKEAIVKFTEAGLDTNQNVAMISTMIPSKSKVKSFNLGIIRKAEIIDTNNFLHIIDKAEKQEGYILSTNEFNELLKKVSLIEREIWPTERVFEKVSNFIFSKKNAHLNILRKKSEGIQRYSEDVVPEYKYKGVIKKDPEGYELGVEKMKEMEFKDAEDILGNTIELLDKQERLITSIETDMSEKLREFQEKLKSKTEKEYKKLQELTGELQDKIQLLSKGQEANLKYKDIFIFVRDRIEGVKKYPDKMEYIEKQVKKLYPEFKKGYQQILDTYEVARKEKELVRHPEEKDIFLRPKPKTFSEVQFKKRVQADWSDQLFNWIKSIGDKVGGFISGLLGLDSEVEDLQNAVENIELTTATIKLYADDSKEKMHEELEGKDNKVDKNEFEEGIKVEEEHKNTIIKLIKKLMGDNYDEKKANELLDYTIKNITLDHLSELNDYYTKLNEMENKNK